MTDRELMQQPVARVYRHGKASNGTPWHGVHWFDEGTNMPDGTLLYTHPALQRQPLTDEQMQTVYREFMLYQDGLTPAGMQRVTRAIEQAHGITGGEK